MSYSFEDATFYFQRACVQGDIIEGCLVLAAEQTVMVFAPQERINPDLLTTIRNTFPHPPKVQVFYAQPALLAAEIANRSYH